MKPSRELLFILIGAGALAACAPMDSPSGQSSGQESELASSRAAIIRGENAERGHEPWIARITDTAAWMDGKTSCTGTLIDPEWVLTAAHCIYGKKRADLKVVLGDHSPGVAEDTEQTFAVHSYYGHPSYSTWTKNGDIALIRLSAPAEINASVQTAQLATETPSTGMYGLGFGLIDDQSAQAPVLQRGSMDLLPNDQCSSVALPATEFCAAGSTGEPYYDLITLGPGDSGGPLLTYGRRNVVGVASRSNSPASDWPGMYTRVSSYRSWIIEKLGHDPRRDMRLTWSGSMAEGYIELYCDKTQKSIWASTSVGGTELSMDCPDSWVWVECSLTDLSSARAIAGVQRQVGLGQIDPVSQTSTQVIKWYWHAKGEKASFDCSIR